jgi:DNA-binding NarL/FixJ family response regulator
MATKVLLVDDHSMMRSGLRALLQGVPGLQVIGEAEDGRTAVSLIKQTLPDVVVMDLRMPDLNGIEATRQATEAHRSVKVIGLSANADRQSVAEMLRAGAKGYVLKEAAFEQLAEAIRTVLQNKIFLSPSITDLVVEHWADGDAAVATVYGLLSAREREVLQLIAEGKATKEVAACLSVSVKTAETHRRNLMEKLKVDSVAELTKYAIREGLTSL